MVDHTRQALTFFHHVNVSGKEIAIPDFLREQYFQQTGMEVATTSFREPGLHTATANTVRSFPGHSEKDDPSEPGHTAFDFDFEKEAYSL